MAEAWKPRKVSISCVEHRFVLDGESSQMGIHDEGACDLSLPEERKQDDGMLLARLQQAHTRLGKPVFDGLESLFDRERIGEQTCVSCDSQKREEARPRQADWLRTRESLLDPPPSLKVEWAREIVSVDDEVGVDQNHGASSFSSNPSIWSKSKPGRAPRALAGTLKRTSWIFR